MKTITARYNGHCFLCDGAFAAGESITMYAKWSHTSCVQREEEKERELEAERARHNVAWTAARKRGEHATITMSDTEIVVRNAWDYAQAKDLAFALIENASVATGIRYTLTRRTRNGKKYLGRELRSGGEYSSLTYHEGWAFPYKAPAAAAA